MAISKDKMVFNSRLMNEMFPVCDNNGDTPTRTINEPILDLMLELVGNSIHQASRNEIRRQMFFELTEWLEHHRKELRDNSSSMSASSNYMYMADQMHHMAERLNAKGNLLGAFVTKEEHEKILNGNSYEDRELNGPKVLGKINLKPGHEDIFGDEREPQPEDSMMHGQ